MTLSNVFIGKKVVQKIYLSNALIYQSKGWETLPSTVQEVWTKDYSNFRSIDNCIVDLNNYIYLLSGNLLYKLDPEGTVVWSKTFPGAVKLRVDNDNILYVISIKQKPSSSDSDVAFVSKVDDMGNILEEADISGNYIIATITNFIIDDNYLYVSTRTGSISGTYYHLFKVDKNLKLIAQNDIAISGDTLTTDEGPYLYFFNSSQLLRVEKKDLTDWAVLFNGTSSADSAAMDELGNIIYSTNNSIYRYNLDSKTTTLVKSSNNSLCKQFCIDHQQNICSINGNNSAGYRINLVKISSDNTVIYDIKIDSAPANYVLNGKLVVDNNGNIYYLYVNSSYQLIIKKLINLVKEGN